MLSVRCPGCAREYKVQEQFAGKTMRCRACGTAIPIPAAASAAAGGASGRKELEETAILSRDVEEGDAPSPGGAAADTPEAGDARGEGERPKRPGARKVSASRRGAGKAGAAARRGRSASGRRGAQGASGAAGNRTGLYTIVGGLVVAIIAVVLVLDPLGFFAGGDAPGNGDEVAGGPAEPGGEGGASEPASGGNGAAAAGGEAAGTPETDAETSTDTETGTGTDTQSTVAEGAAAGSPDAGNTAPGEAGDGGAATVATASAADAEAGVAGAADLPPAGTVDPLAVFPETTVLLLSVRPPALVELFGEATAGTPAEGQGEFALQAGAGFVPGLRPGSLGRVLIGLDEGAREALKSYSEDMQGMPAPSGIGSNPPLKVLKDLLVTFEGEFDPQSVAEWLRARAGQAQPMEGLVGWSAPLEEGVDAEGALALLDAGLLVGAAPPDGVRRAAEAAGAGGEGVRANAELAALSENFAVGAPLWFAMAVPAGEPGILDPSEWPEAARARVTGFLKMVGFQEPPDLRGLYLALGPAEAEESVAGIDLKVRCATAEEAQRLLAVVSNLRRTAREGAQAMLEGLSGGVEGETLALHYDIDPAVVQQAMAMAPGVSAGPAGSGGAPAAGGPPEGFEGFDEFEDVGDTGGAPPSESGDAGGAPPGVTGEGEVGIPDLEGLEGPGRPEAGDPSGTGDAPEEGEALDPDELEDLDLEGLDDIDIPGDGDEPGGSTPGENGGEPPAGEDGK